MRKFGLIALILAALSLPASSQIPISLLPNATLPLTGSEYVPLSQSSVTVKATTSDVSGYSLTTGAVTATGTSTARNLPTRFSDAYNLKDFGAVADNSTDNTGFVTTAIAAAVANRKALFIPGGVYYVAGTPTCAISSGKSLTVIGAGQDVTFLRAGSGASLFSCSLNGAASTIHVRDLTLETSGIPSTVAKAIAVTQLATISNPANTAPSDVVRTTIRGADGYGVTDGWSCGVSITSVSNVSFTNDYFSGPVTTGGAGICISGSSSTYAVSFQISQSTFNYLTYGVNFGTYAQGLFLTQNNFATDYGVYSGPGQSGGSQLTSVANQWRCATACIYDASSITPVQAIGDYMFIGTGGTAINLLNSQDYYISGETIQIIGGASGTKGISVGTTTASSYFGGIIGPNNFLGPDLAIQIGANANFAQVTAGQNYSGVAANITSANITAVIRTSNGLSGAAGITGAVNNAGLTELTIPSTSTLVNGEVVLVSGVTGTVNVNNINTFSTITVVDGTHVNLNSVPWPGGGGVYTAGGILSIIPGG